MMMEMEIVTYEDMAAALLKTWGQVWALDFAVSMMLALHPDKKRLMKIWDECLPERIDEWMGMPEYTNPDFRERVHETIAHLRLVLQVSAEADGQDDGGADGAG